MRIVLAAVAAVGLAVPAVAACPAHDTASHDTMTTASIQAPVSTREDARKDTADKAEMTGGVAAEEIREERAE